MTTWQVSRKQWRPNGVQAEDNRKSECRSVMERIRIDPIVMHGRGLHYPTRKWADFCDFSQEAQNPTIVKW